MMKAYEVMTHALATCAPDTKVTQVAAIMRDRDIGDVLVVEDGKLCGIVTDRDLALRSLTDEEDPRQIPISKFMSCEIVSGEPTWSLEQVGKMMATHQIRRLPILQNGQLAGIVSLGDLARGEDHKNAIAKSLQAVSTPSGGAAQGRGHAAAWIGLVLTALTAGLAAWLTMNHSGQVAAKQIRRSGLYHSVQQAASQAQDKVSEAASSKPVRALGQQMRSNLKGFSAQLPTLSVKPPKRRFSLFG